MLPADLRKLSLPTSRTILPRLKPIFYLFKVLILPQALTAGALYMLLLYLLKDSDLLDAQRNRLGRNEKERGTDDEDSAIHKPLRGVQVNMLPCSHESDVDLIDSSADGQVVISVGLDNSLCLWRFTDHAGKGTREILRSPELSKDDVITGVTISWDGKVVAALTADGAVYRWEISEDGQPLARDALQLGDVSPAKIRLLQVHPRSDDPFIVRVPSPDPMSRNNLLVLCDDGSVLLVSDSSDRVMIVPPSSSSTRTWLLTRGTGPHHDLFVLSATEETIKLHRPTGTTWSAVAIPVTVSAKLTAASISRNDLVLGYRTGLIEIFDLNGDPVAAIGGVGGSSSPTSRSFSSIEGVRQVAMSSPDISQCTTCGLESTESTFILSSTATQVFVDRLSSRGNVACRCTRRGSTVEDLNSINSAAAASPSRLVIPPTSTRNGFSPGASPKKSPALLPPVSNGDFPLSYHGTRRLSALYRDEASPGAGSGGLSMTPSSPDSDIEIVPLGSISSPGGGSLWCVSGDRVVGMRRVGGGIDDAQWEVWSLDLRSPWNGNQLVVDTASLTSLLHRAPPVVESGVRAQRAERLLSLSGRAPFPSLGASFSVETFAPLAYTEIRPFHSIAGVENDEAGNAFGKVIIGLGNRVGVITIPHGKGVRRLRTSLSGIALGMGGLGMTPPPPSARKETGDNSKKLL
jgi:WD40 repeat protein